MERSSDSPDRPNVVAVVGSPRTAGNTSYLVDVALDELARRGVAVEKISLGEHRIVPCEGHDDCEDRAACPLSDDAGRSSTACTPPMGSFWRRRSTTRTSRAR